MCQKGATASEPRHVPVVWCPTWPPAARWRRAVTGVVAFPRVSLTSLALFRFFAFLAVACLMRVHVARGGAHHVFVVQGL